MRKKALPIGVLFMVLVVLLAAVGISYGYWSEALQAEGTLTTGNLNVYWDNASNPGTIGGSPGSAACGATVPSGHSSNLLQVTLTDMNPGATCTISADIVNNGTVPVDIVVGDPTRDTSTDNIDAWLDVPTAYCTNSSYIPVGGSITCTATFEMLSGAPNSTQGKSTAYTATVTANQHP
jgi:predicted ribosomally synthesized peptide with SipW-like signal peptide